MPSPHQQFAHLQIPFKDIRTATNNFADENLIQERAHSKVYTGQLLQSGRPINIVARLSGFKYSEPVSRDFWTHIFRLCRLQHENLVSIVGFCDEADMNIIVTKNMVHGSLDEHLSSPTLTWMQRLQICLGVARALSFLHFDTGRGYGFIHGNIKSSKILLDETWEAKVSGFEFCKSILAVRRHHLVLTKPCGTMGYVDPISTETCSVTQKSDVYSFGVVMLEVLCGRLAPIATRLYQDGKLDEIIDPNLRKQMAQQSLTIFSEIIYHCLKRQRAQRPDMENIVRRLQKALDLQRKQENPEHSKTSAEDTWFKHLKGKNLEHMKIKLSDIVFATEDFAETNLIGEGAYGKVYKGELYHVGSKSSSTIKGMNKDELPKKQSVAIKCIINRQDGQGEEGFFAEIAMLTSCNHPNIVSLRGFCNEEHQQILVYELAPNGSLDDYLGNSGNMSTLTWMQRIKMCLDIANGLNYLHNTMQNEERIIHRDIKSANILLNEKWEAMIADFGLSRFLLADTLNTSKIAGTEVYMDPEYRETGSFKRESDTYSFGVVLFEILCGKLAYNEIYYVGSDMGLPSIVRRCYNEGTLKEMHVDPKIKEEAANIFTLDRGPNQDSLDTFIKIGYQCLAETQAARPTMKVVINELEKALQFQENSKDSLKFSFEDIKFATQNFSYNNLIEKGGFGKVYKGEVRHNNEHNIIVAKRLGRYNYQGEHDQFLTELEILFDYKHENVIRLVGYCDELDGKIIVYEYASRGSLDRHLKDDCLTWMKRLEICIGVATGLEFLHGNVVNQGVAVIHRGIKSSNILLNDDWKAKITNFQLSLLCPIKQEMGYIFEDDVVTYGNMNPRYFISSVLTTKSDIFSFGLVLFEILCGRLTNQTHNRKRLLYHAVKAGINEGKFDRLVFEGIKVQIAPESLATFRTIACQCLHEEEKSRPTISEVLVQLRKALEFQEDYEIWKPKLPADYEKIIQMSESHDFYSGKNKKDLYALFSKGILLQEGKLLFSLGSNVERNEMISARKFSYKNPRSRKWQTVQKSRFSKVAEMLDISSLKIQIRIRTQFLSPGVNYGVNLIFRFCGQRKSLAERMYVNLKYKKGKEKFHAYFATWREDEWMVIELYRFYNHKEETDFEVLLESFSRCYCESHAIYVEGIEFRAIHDNVKHGEIEKSKEVQVMKSNSQSDCEDIFKRSENDEEGGKLRLVASKMQTTNDQMFFVKKVLSETFDGELLNSRPKVQFRFEGVTELLRQQVFYIKCKIKSQMLSPNTENVCYLVFKLSEKCYGLHCPVIVRDLHHWRNKDTGILYFRTPSPWNLHDTDWVPKKRKDGWMEVIVWKFHSTNVLKNDDLSLNLKLISYQGTMSGLIVRGLEFQTT